MVHQMPCPSPELMFVASSLEDEHLAQGEIARWAETHGYRPPQDAPTFVFYRDGARAREWRLIERPASGTAH